MSEPKEILVKARTDKGYTQQEMADKIGVSLRNYQRYEEGLFPKYKSGPIQDIDKVLNTDLYTAIYSGEREEILETGDQELNSQYLARRRRIKNTSEEFRVALVTVKARAGYAHSYDSVDLINSLDKYAIPPGVSYAGAIWRYFEVDGDSMEPSLSSGDHVLCSQVPSEDWDNVKNYYVYVLVTNTDVAIKRVFVKEDGKWVLISDNEAACPQKLFEPKSLKELWVFRRLIKKTISPKKEFKIKI